MNKLYFTFTELFNSDTAKKNKINNTTSDPRILTNLMNVVYYFANPFRIWLNKPIKIECGYRCPALNKILGGQSTGHPEGYCIDIKVDGMTQEQLFNKIREAISKGIVEVDQLIWEKDSNCIHVGYRYGNNRHQILIRTKVNNKFIYSAA